MQSPRGSALREGGGVESDHANVEQEKRAAAEAAAELVEDGMVVGLGTGTTVAYLLPALGRRHLDISCVATSPATEELARAEGISVGPFEGIARLDMAIDGADQVDPSGWLIKGGGGAHTREKIVAAAADRFVVIVSSNKVVRRLAPPVPLELYGVRARRVPCGHSSRRGRPPRSGQPRRRRVWPITTASSTILPSSLPCSAPPQGSWSMGSFLGPWCPGS